MLWNVAQLQIAADLARPDQGADHGSNAAAVDESDISEMQNDGATVAQQPVNMVAQRFSFSAGDNAPFASDDCHPPDVPRFKGQVHGNPKRRLAKLQDLFRTLSSREK